MVPPQFILIEAFGAPGGIFAEEFVFLTLECFDTELLEEICLEIKPYA